MTAFPSSLPKPIVALTVKGTGSTARSTMKTGLPYQRQRFTAEQRVFTVRWIFNGAELTTFENFFADDIAGGADWFDIELATGGEGLISTRARFVKNEYAIAHKGVMCWQVSAQLELDRFETWSEGLYDLLVELGDVAAVENAADAMHELVNVTIPPLL